MTASPYCQILLQVGSMHTLTLRQVSRFFLHKAKEMGPATTLAPTSMGPIKDDMDHLHDSTG